MSIRVCVAGATGWTGASVARGVLAATGLTLVSAVARATKGQDIGEVLGLEKAGVTISGTVAEALGVPADVLIDYTNAESVKGNVMAAIDRGLSVVVGTSGLTAADFDDIDQAARAKGVGAVSGNFSLTAALMQHLALIAARHVPQFEVLDYSWATKEDVPSGTARELAERLGQVQQPKMGRAVDTLHGPPETRGANVGGVQVHSIRLPGYTLRCEAVFGMEGERLTISHEAGQSAEPYVFGSLIAARKAVEIKGLVRGLDALLF